MRWRPVSGDRKDRSYFHIRAVLEQSCVQNSCKSVTLRSGRRYAEWSHYFFQIVRPKYLAVRRITFRISSALDLRPVMVVLYTLSMNVSFGG